MIECPACHAPNIPGAELCEACHSPLVMVERHRIRSPIVARALSKAPVTSLESSKPLYVKADESAHDLVRKLNDGGCSAALVVDDQGHLIGIVTERDLLLKIKPLLPGQSSPKVAEIMTASPHCLSHSDSVAVALNTMAVYGYRRVPVKTDEGYALVNVRELFDYLMKLEIPEESAA